MLTACLIRVALLAVLETDPPQKPAENPPTTLEGMLPSKRPQVIKVVDSNGMAMPSARVRVWHRMGIPEIDETTDNGGKIVVLLLPRTYHLRINKDGFREYDTHVLLRGGLDTFSLEEDLELRYWRRRQVTELSLTLAISSAVVAASAIHQDNNAGRALAIVSSIPGGGVVGSWVGSRFGFGEAFVGGVLGLLGGGVLGAATSWEPGLARPATTALALFPVLAAHFYLASRSWQRTPSGDLQ